MADGEKELGQDPGQWLRAFADTQTAMMEQALGAMRDVTGTVAGVNDEATVERISDFWRDGLTLWQRLLDPAILSTPDNKPAQDQPAQDKGARPDKRFADEAWNAPIFDAMRRSYQLASDHLMRGVDALEGIDPDQRRRLRFSAQMLIDAMSPSNFPFANPEVLREAMETGGESMRNGMMKLVDDLGRGQLTHSDATAFEVGRNLAVTPGKVIKRTPLYELIYYMPTTEHTLKTPLVIFPPWINRFYILDLTPQKSFIRWAVEQGVSVFIISWKSADASMKDVIWDDYAAAQIDAIDTVRALLDVSSAHTIGYCVAGTTLAATLAVLAANDEADKVASATFFTAQVDFSDAGDLKHFIDDEQLALVSALSPEGYLDGRYMAAAFNALRGRDLIWNYVTNNYLLGREHSAFDLLHWNGDTTNLPAKWHLDYLRDLYRDNLLVSPGALSIAGTPIDLSLVETPAYVQAGREDHIAPAESVWKLTNHFKGAMRFVLAGSGHIAGVVNPPSSGKYEYWTNDASVESLDEFTGGATRTKGSWWPDWFAWLHGHGDTTVPATGTRIPGAGDLKALTDAPGDYVRAR